jgi:hypothetical protein
MAFSQRGRASEQHADYVDQTQQLTATQDICSPTPRPCGLARLTSLSLPPSEFEENSLQSSHTSSIDTQLLKNHLVFAAARCRGIEDSEMLGWSYFAPIFREVPETLAIYVRYGDPNAIIP